MKVDNVDFSSDVQQQRMANVYKQSCEFIHRFTGKPVMVAPFFSNSPDFMSAEEYAVMWSKILTFISL